GRPNEVTGRFCKAGLVSGTSDQGRTVCVRRGPPRKTARRQPLLAEPESLALVAEHCQRRPFAIAEDEYRADERIVLPRLPAPPRQAVKAPANRGRRDGHPDRPLRRALQPDWALQKRRRRAVTAAAS